MYIQVEDAVTHSTKFRETERGLDGFFAALTLSRNQNDRLASLMREHLDSTTQDAFVSGFHAGVEYAAWLREQKKQERRARRKPRKRRERQKSAIDGAETAENIEIPPTEV